MLYVLVFVCGFVVGFLVVDVVVVLWLCCIRGSLCWCRCWGCYWCWGVGSAWMLVV